MDSMLQHFMQRLMAGRPTPEMQAGPPGVFDKLSQALPDFAQSAGRAMAPGQPTGQQPPMMGGGMPGGSGGGGLAAIGSMMQQPPNRKMGMMPQAQPSMMDQWGKKFGNAWSQRIAPPDPNAQGGQEGIF